MPSTRSILKYLSYAVALTAALFLSFFLGIVHTTRTLSWSDHEYEGKKYEMGCVVIPK